MIRIFALSGYLHYLHGLPSADRFSNPENNLQTQFNIAHSLHRVVVENTFGRFKNRFSSLKGLNVKKISTAVQLTESTDYQ